MTQKKAQDAEPAQNVNDLHPEVAEATPSTEELNQLTAIERSPAGALVPGEISGEIGVTDVKLPTLRIIQKMSDNPQHLDLGTISVNGDTVVENDNGEAVVTIVSIVKKYEEVVPFGSIPQRFNKLEEAVAAGFKLCRSKQDRDSGAPIVEETAQVLLVCHKPDGAMDRSFPFEFGDTRCVPAVWFLKSYAYGNIAKTIFTKLQFDLRGTDILEARWKITTEKRSNSFGEFYVPHIQLLADSNLKEFVDAVRNEVAFA